MIITEKLQIKENQGWPKVNPQNTINNKTNIENISTKSFTKGKDAIDLPLLSLNPNLLHNNNNKQLK